MTTNASVWMCMTAEYPAVMMFCERKRKGRESARESKGKVSETNEPWNQE